MAKTTDTKRHARLGPSSSHIWLTCLAAPAEWLKAPPHKVGVAANEGTLAHTLCEAALILDKIPWKTGMKFNFDGVSLAVTDEMLDAVKLYYQIVKAIRDLSHWSFIEKEISLAWLWENDKAPEEIFGTLDFCACDGLTLYIVDFKYGRGHFIKPEHNTQLLCYAIGALEQLRKERPDLADTVETVSLMIVQPRGGGDPVRQWSMPVAEILYWGFSTLKPSVDKITNGAEKSYNPGAWCYFCAASFTCPAYTALKNANAADDFPDDQQEELV